MLETDNNRKFRVDILYLILFIYKHKSDNGARVWARGFFDARKS